MPRKKKQIYAAILVLAAALLLMDRALRGGSIQVASAAMARSLEALGVETSVQSGALVAAAPFPGPLPEKNIAEGLRNVFVLNRRMRNRLLGLSEGSSSSASRGQAGLTPAAVFEREHRLSGTMVGDRVSFAIVDGAWLRVGDRLDNCQVTAITGTTVSWKCVDGLSTLSVIEDFSASAEQR